MGPERRDRRWPFVASALVHAVALTVLTRVAGTVTPPAPARLELLAHAAEEDSITHLVFAPSTGVAAGGGGGGNRHAGPIRNAEGRGRDRTTLRVARPLSSTTAPPGHDAALPGVLLDARSLASGNINQIGLPEGGVPSGTSTGPGSGGGVGSGTGSGIGSGVGPGIGPGRGGGVGGGVYRIGGGVSAPTVIREVRPSYPPDSLRDRIQGSVVLELVVTVEGMPTDIRVVRALASDLDEAAVRAVRQWRFNPGRLGQTPVNVRVTVVLDFFIH